MRSRALNAQVRKAVRVRGHFPSEEAATKLICTFPFSIERIRKDFMDVPEEETRMMVCDNVARLYGLA